MDIVSTDIRILLKATSQLGHIEKMIKFVFKWCWTTARFLKFMAVSSAKMPNPEEHCGSSKILVPVCPWFGSDVPWYSVAMGMLLARRGNQVIYLLEDNFRKRQDWRYRLQLQCLNLALRLNTRQLITRSSQIDDDHSSSLADSEIKLLARMQAIWFCRGEQNVVKDQILEIEARLRRYSKVVCAALRRFDCDLVIVPGGILETSSIWMSLSKLNSIRCASFDDGGHGLLLLGVDGVASQLPDLPDAFKPIIDSEKASLLTPRLLEMATEELHARMQGTDKFRSQASSYTIGENIVGRREHVLIALNSPWDSAALGLHAVFRSNTDWVIDTVEFLLNISDLPIVIRQHPAERHQKAASTDDLKSILNNRFPDQDRISFITADAAVNTYSLLKLAKFTLCYTSTIGVESVLLGIPCITESTCYYSGLGVVNSTLSRREYFEFIKKACLDDLAVTIDQKHRAGLVYYLSQICNWHATLFTPTAVPNWVGLNAEYLEKMTSVDRILTALEGGIPLCAINHLAIAEQTT